MNVEQPTELYSDCSHIVTPEMLDSDQNGIYCESCGGYVTKRE